MRGYNVEGRFVDDSNAHPRVASVIIYRATLCASSVFAVVRCPSVCLSVCPFLCHIGVLYPDGWRYRQTSLSAQ